MQFATLLSVLLSSQLFQHATADVLARQPAVTPAAVLDKRQDPQTCADSGATLCPDRTGCCPSGAACTRTTSNIAICDNQCNSQSVSCGGNFAGLCCNSGSSCNALSDGLCSATSFLNSGAMFSVPTILSGNASLPFLTASGDISLSGTPTSPIPTNPTAATTSARNPSSTGATTAQSGSNSAQQTDASTSSTAAGNQVYVNRGGVFQTILGAVLGFLAL